VVAKWSSVEPLALLRLSSSVLDLVITGQDMLELAGVEFARRVLTMSPDIGIVLCTGLAG